MSGCKLCGSGNTSGFGQKGHPHTFCHACKGHEYEGQLIDGATWERWMNGEIERPAREDQFDLFGEGA
ncbi:hypothetical protein [Halomonas borealis]|uniref:hypothetical protein n=1 Tax=Halomonas borealis TaxID=2508710 RepID=UPI00109F1EC2|nr:hypothetical protein [Halomonas borealis]